MRKRGSVIWNHLVGCFRPSDHHSSVNVTMPDQVDPTFLPFIRCQRGPPSASFARLQSRQFPAHAGDARPDQGSVADEPQGKADQDRRESREPRPLCRIPDGRGRHSPKSLRRHPANDRGTPATAGHVDSLRGWVLRVPTKTMREVCLDNKKLAAKRLSTGVRKPPNCIGSQRDDNQRDGLRLENRRRRT